MVKSRALFLDRDGVINKSDGYILNFKNFKFLPGVKKAIKYANKKKYLVIIITNQSGVGRSFLSEKQLNNLHKKMKDELYQYNCAIIDDIFYAPYFSKSKIKKYRKNKNDRKPGNGMFLKAIKKWNVNISSSFFIGDKITDKYAAQKSNIKFYFKKKISLYKQILSIVR